MILRSLSIAYWRCFIDPVDVGPFEDGLNIIYAPNATGKSTLFEALCRGMLDGHRVGGREIEAIRPWGRSLAPTVTVEFAHNGTDYRITKRFLDGANSKLERKENGRLVDLAVNDKADETVRGIITRDAPRRGLAQSKNWGLAQVLWAPQGNLAIGELSGDVLVDIRNSLGAQVSGPEASPIEKQIQDSWGEFFTTGGNLKTGKGAPAIVSLREKLPKAESELITARLQQQAFDETAQRVEELRLRHAKAKTDAETISKALKEASSQADSYKTLLLEKKQREERLKTTEAKRNELKQKVEIVKGARKELDDAREALGKLELNIPQQEQKVQDCQKEADEAKTALNDVRKRHQLIDTAQETAEQARRFAENSKTLADLNSQLDKIFTAQITHAERKKERARLVAPDAKTLWNIGKALKDIDEAQVRIDASLITLEITPEQDGSLKVISGEETGTHTLQQGSPTQIKGSPEVIADLPGIARLRAWGPAGSIDVHRDDKAAAQRKLEELTRSFSTTDLTKLENLSKKGEELDKKVAEAETKLETLLSGESIDDIKQERSQVEAVMAKVLEQHSDWKNSLPDAEALKIGAQESKTAFIKEIETAEPRWEAAQAALAAATTQKATLSTRMEETKKLLDSSQLKLAWLTTDGKSDEEREEELKRAALAWEGARAKLEDVERQISAFGEDPISIMGKLERQLETADETATSALSEEKIEEGKLQQLAALGTYSTLSLVEEEVANLQRAIVSEQLRVDAIDLVHRTLDQCRAEALAGVAGPVEAAATQILQRIAGKKLGSLHFGESFGPAHVLPEISGAPVSLDSVSGGEKEQIYLATRLALAEVLAKDERQLVVLDDVLTATDADRLTRIMTILEESARRLQILILTCHPERYRGLEGARFIDLEGVVGDGG